MVRTRALLMTAVFLATACTENGATQLDDIREAVFRHQMHEREQFGLREDVCLSIGGEVDPSDAFMARFACLGARASKGSGCGLDADYQVVLKASGEPAVHYTIKKVTWQSATRAKVNGGFYMAPLASRGDTFTVEKVHGHWVVTSVENEFVS